MQGGGLGETAQRWKVHLEHAQGRHLQRRLLAGGFKGRSVAQKPSQALLLRATSVERLGEFSKPQSMLLQSDEKSNFLFSLSVLSLVSGQDE